MFYIINGNYIGYSELNLHELTKKLKDADFVFVRYVSIDFWLNSNFYRIWEEIALATHIIETIKPATHHLEELNKEELLLSFE